MIESRAARLAAFSAVVLWGVSFVATKAAVQEVSPVTLIFSRFALGVVFLFLLLRLRRQPVVPPRDAWLMVALIGFVGIFVHQATVFLGEGFGRRKVVGLIIGAVGTLVLITREALSLGVLALPAMLIPFFVGAAGWQE
ncbi:MAG: EamA family transporter [Gemmatimonadales bacterium]